MDSRKWNSLFLGGVGALTVLEVSYLATDLEGPDRTRDLSGLYFGSTDTDEGPRRGFDNNLGIELSVPSGPISYNECGEPYRST